MPGSNLLASLRGKLDHVRLTCTRCGKQEVVSVDDLAKTYGWKASLPDVRWHLSRGCPRRTASIYARCDPVFSRVTPREAGRER